jgi:hypothetical protein
MKPKFRSAYHFFTVSKRAIMLNPNLQVGFRTNVASDSELYLYMLQDQSSKISQIPCGAEFDKHLYLKNYHKEMVIAPLVVFFLTKKFFRGLMPILTITKCTGCIITGKALVGSTFISTSGTQFTLTTTTETFTVKLMMMLAARLKKRTLTIN